MRDREINKEIERSTKRYRDEGIARRKGDKDRRNRQDRKKD